MSTSRRSERRVLWLRGAKRIYVIVFQFELEYEERKLIRMLWNPWTMNSTPRLPSFPSFAVVAGIVRARLTPPSNCDYVRTVVTFLLRRPAVVDKLNAVP